VSESVRAYAPATVSNLGSGFDVLGLALQGPGDTVTARKVPGSGVHIHAIHGDGGKLPLEASANTAGIAARETLRRAGIDIGVELLIEKGLPLGSGLGSSAASAAAAALATNRLVGSPLRRNALVEACLEAEIAVSGRHADNIAPALLGGLVLVRGTEPLDLVRLPLPPDLWVVVALPAMELETRRARGVLPPQIPLRAMVEVSANLGSLVAACFSGDLALLSRSIQDPVVGPARAPLIPGCTDVIAAALDAGALGSAISGAGPSIFALCRSSVSAGQVAERMVAAFAGASLQASVITSPADCPGARILS
jgi:homoserine kinase